MRIIIKPKIINKYNFRKYGNLISKKYKKPTQINNGYALKFNNLSNIKTSKNSGSTRISIFEARPRKFPLKIDMLEMHPAGTQVFFPIDICSFIVVVAPVNKIPIVNQIESFIVPPKTGINYKIGVWHYPLIAIIKSNFLVIDRKGPGKNLKKFKFVKENIIIKR